MAWKNENDEWVTNDGRNMGTGAGAMEYAQSWDDKDKQSSGSSSSNAAAAAASAAREAEYQANRAQGMAAIESSGKAYSAEEDKVFDSILAFNRKVQQFYEEGHSCWNAENWRGAVNAFTKGIKYIESPEWEANKQRFQNYCERGYMLSARLGDSRTASMEKVYHIWKSNLAELYFERGLAKMKIGNDPTANRDFRINETLKGEILEAEKQNPYLKE
jgi:hypothetical protein